MNWRKIFILALALYIVLLLTGAFVLFLLSRNLPPLSMIETYKPPLATQVLDRNGEVISQFFVERRTPIRLSEVPESMKKAFIVLEDRRFYEHWGVSPRDILRAIVINLKAMRKLQGASTITQQLARNMFLTQERTLKRKLKEMILAIQIERAFSKDEILEKYLNQIYFGHGVYGVETAAQYYFGKSVSELNLAEIAMLVGIPRSPLLYSPFRNFKRAKKRQELILRKMLRYGVIDEETYKAAISTPIVLRERKKEPLGEKALYFLEMVRQYVSERYGDEFLYTSGGKIYTTLDLEMQIRAEEIFDSTLNELEKTYKIEPKKSDYSPDSGKPPNYLQGAMIVLDLKTGGILALIGGRDFKESQFNRAIQARRQPGSAFKPFVYTAAVDNGFSPNDKLYDLPIALKTNEEETWYPDNYDHRYLGEVSLRKALAKSRNLATINLILQIGPSTVVEYARKMGIESPIPPYPSIAIGSATLTLIEMVRGYATLANYGTRVKPYFIEKIEDADGKILEENVPEKVTVLDSVTSYIMINMLESVLDEGTGVSARTKYGFYGIAAGKTGTTDDYHDAWFIGFTPEIVAGVWVGFDSLRTITEGATGARFALPIWARFMKAVYNPDSSADFPIPDGVVFAEVCETSGLLATPYCPVTRTEVFRQGLEPKTWCNIHTPSMMVEIKRTFEEFELKSLRGTKTP